MRFQPKASSAGLWLAVCLPLAAACSDTGDWQDRAEATLERSRAKAAEARVYLSELRARLAEEVDSTKVRHADELAALDERRREIEVELEQAARAGEREWERASARLEQELEELGKRADELREHIEDPL